MEEIIQRSGGSKSHIYREFGGKDGLFLASVKFLCDEVQLSIETVDVSALSVKARSLACAGSLNRKAPGPPTPCVCRRPALSEGR